MDPKQLMDYVIAPALILVDLYSPDAAHLVLGTACVESNCGQYVHQINGPALGIYQMEPNTHDDIWDSYLRYRPELSLKILETCAMRGLPNAGMMVWNLRYATIMCRVHYYRVSAALPPANDVDKMARYWKLYYNTEQGKGKIEDFLKKYEV